MKREKEAKREEIMRSKARKYGTFNRNPRKRKYLKK